jgi:hypothetical protein
MITTLFIKAEKVKETTSISGTTDNDSISQKIYYAQITDIVRVLGQPLYDKIYTDLSTPTPLTGEYLKIFDTYIIDMHVFFTAHYFTLFNEVKSSNVGNTILSLERGLATDKTVQLAEQYKALAISVENNFRKYMEKSVIVEWNFDKKAEETTNFNDFY